MNLTPGELDDLVAFLKGLTDQRVVYRRAPFDNPQLFVPNGHRVINGVAAMDSDGTAASDDGGAGGEKKRRCAAAGVPQAVKLRLSGRVALPKMQPC